MRLLFCVSAEEATVCVSKNAPDSNLCGEIIDQRQTGLKKLGRKQTYSG